MPSASMNSGYRVPMNTEAAATDSSTLFDNSIDSREIISNLPPSPILGARQAYQNKNTALGISRKRMYRSQHTGAHHEGSQQTEGKCGYRQQYGPTLERAALFRNGQRMDKCRAHQPGHKGGVFNRIPEPPTAPAEFIVSPPTAQHDSRGQERPSHGGPR